MDDKRHLHRYVKPVPTTRPRTKHALEILQQRHQFLRDDTDDTAASKHGKASSSSTEEWEERLSKSWYDKLFREYALCDLSRYKEGGVALRWRIEDEVLERIGELTCGALNCKYHQPSFSPRSDRDDDDMTPLVPKALTPYQLNFQYQEHGQAKAALVKVVLCNRCARKLTWKKDRERAKAKGERDLGDVSDEPENRTKHRSDRRSSQSHRHDGHRDASRHEAGPSSHRQNRSSRHRSRSRSRDRQDRAHPDRRKRSRSP